jgi:hypothetical protein
MRKIFFYIVLYRYSSHHKLEREREREREEERKRGSESDDIIHHRHNQTNKETIELID